MVGCLLVPLYAGFLLVPFYGIRQFGWELWASLSLALAPGKISGRWVHLLRRFGLSDGTLLDSPYKNVEVLVQRETESAPREVAQVCQCLFSENRAAVVDVGEVQNRGLEKIRTRTTRISFGHGPHCDTGSQARQGLLHMPLFSAT